MKATKREIDRAQARLDACRQTLSRARAPQSIKRAKQAVALAEYNLGRVRGHITLG